MWIAILSKALLSQHSGANLEQNGRGSFVGGGVVDLTVLQKIMIENGLAIRAVPIMKRIVVDLRHKGDFPDGHSQYLEEYKREMWVEERKNPHGGQFVVESDCGTKATIHFKGEKFYDSVEELIEDVVGL